VWVAETGNAVEANKLLVSSPESASTYECILLAITYTLIYQQTRLVCALYAFRLIPYFIRYYTIVGSAPKVIGFVHDKRLDLNFLGF